MACPITTSEARHAGDPAYLERAEGGVGKNESRAS